MAKSVGKKLKKFSVETRLKSAEEFKDRVLGMFKAYVKSVIVFGSFMFGKGTGKSDVDVYIIFDDTKMPLKKFDDIREKINADLYKVASSIDPRLHPQPILALTEFIKGTRYTNPLFFNIIRNGYAIYDTGFFIPMRKLLEWGEFPITPEAAHMRMEGVPKRITRVKSVKLYIIAEDLYYAMLDAAQAVLMYVGVGPPSPKNSAKEVREHLVETGLLEEEYAQMLEDVNVFRKKVEYKEVKDISGKEVDEWIKKTEKYVKRFEKLLKKLETDRKTYAIKKNYDVMVNASAAALKNLKKLPKEPEKLPEAFKKYLVESGLVNPNYSELFGKVIEMRRKLEDNELEKISDKEIYMNKEYVRRFVSDVSRIIESPMPKTPDDVMESAKNELETAKEVSNVPKKVKKARKTKKKPQKSK
ncbi:MAG: nucleotidyltransferase domain-containing protein [Candidatus Aenigmarchaeota archaeon]|nr:nucleotidyltransferase domain-containing protein [Candidatus Aenigmarchaeota archaeon]